MTSHQPFPGSSPGLPDRGRLEERRLWRLSFFLWAALGLVLVLSGRCDRKEPDTKPVRSGPSSGMTHQARPRASAPDAATGAKEAGARPAPRDAGVAPGQDGGSARAVTPVSTPASRPPGTLQPLPEKAECGSEAKRFFEMLFCEGQPADPACRKLSAAMERYRKEYREPMRAWLAKERPTGLPETLLYPFAGGDLVSALSAFPDQREFVHLSLEHGGPPAPFKDGKSPKLAQARAMLFRMADLLLRFGESFSVDLQKQEQALLPGVLPMLLVGVKVHGGAPTGLAYLRVTPEGKLVPWNRDELDAPGPRARRLYTTWKDPRFSARFAHLELRFRLPNDTSDRRVIHLSANIANVGLGRAPGVERYLASLGPVALMIKASSFLLWTQDFSRVRDLSFEKARFAISDFSAPYPGWLRKQGFTLALHGRYDCMRNPRLKESAKPWMEAFRKPTSPKLPFRWGYIDCKSQNHVVLVRR